MPASHFFRYLDTVGDGTGITNAVGDYSVTPTPFFFQPPLAVYIHKAIIMIESIAGMWAERYGNIPNGLINGYSLIHRDTDDISQLELNNGIPIKTNAQIGRTGFNVDVKTWGAGDEVLLATCDFQTTGAPLTLKANHKLGIILNDDFTGLKQHFFMVQGIFD